MHLDRRGGRLPLLLVFTAVLLSGCEAALDVQVSLDADGGGLLAVSLRADRQLLERAAEAGADPLAALAASARVIPEWEVQEQEVPEAMGGGRQVELTTRVSGPQQLQERSAELAEALSAEEVDLLDGFSVTVDEDTVALRGRAGLVPTDVTTELGLQPRDAVRLLEELEVFTYRISATLPGAVLDSNATLAPAAGEAGELVWEIPPGESVALSAVGQRPGPSPLLLAAGAGVALLLMFGGVQLLRRRG